MKGQITKSFDVGSLVKADDLLLLDKWIKSKFPFVKYSIKTSNGASFDLDAIEEVLEYDNHPSRKIILINIHANKEQTTLTFNSDLSMSILDN